MAVGSMAVGEMTVGAVAISEMTVGVVAISEMTVGAIAIGGGNAIGNTISSTMCANTALGRTA